MHNIIKILSLWTQLSYGEILKAVPANKKIVFVLLLILIHTVLLIAIAFPGTVWGIYCCSLSGFFFVWNICLDQYSGMPFRPVRKQIVLLEKKAQAFVPENFWGKGFKFLGEYIRIHIPLVAGLLAGIVIAFV